MNLKRMIRGGAVLGLVLAGCGGMEPNVEPDEGTNPELGSAEQGLQHIINWGFETAPAGSYNYTTLSTGSTGLPPWTISGSIDVMSSSYRAPNSGTKSIDLNGLGPGSISQTITTAAGSGYTVRFWVANSPGCTNVNRSARLTFGTSTVSISNSLPGWTQRQYVFNPPTTSTLVKLESTSSGTSCGLSIDDFTVDGP